MGSGAVIGGGFGRFYNYAPTKIEYAIDRFTMVRKTPPEKDDDSMHVRLRVQHRASIVAILLPRSIRPFYPLLSHPFFCSPPQETKRLLDVLDRHLGAKDPNPSPTAGGPYILGVTYSIADMCIWPW